MKKEMKEMKEEMKELKEYLRKVTTEHQQDVKSLQENIENLQSQNNRRNNEATELGKRMKTLQEDNNMLRNIIDEMDQDKRMNDIIVTGHRIKPRSYAKAVNNEGEPDEMDMISAEQQVVNFLQSKEIENDINTIETCIPLNGRNNNATPVVLVKLVNRKSKMALLRQGKKLKGTNVHMNEHLTKRNAGIAKKARDLRKQGKIQGTWSTNCKIYIKLNGGPEARVIVVHDIKDLDNF
ncbi:uncharacterized protein LOC133635554 [Entelurus aequoreus]|uniref:uncharacterized protein LOC133635554 n=1 Tax=Entelurus aequoreus TaxID=161455 RepID=UPI002B1D14AA|nr:uncharacterized protein LOC133635554 [Entelurus aequoreus]